MTDQVTILGRAGPDGNLSGDIQALWVGEMDLDIDSLTLTCPRLPGEMDSRLCSALRGLHRNARWVHCPVLPGFPRRWRVKGYRVSGYPGRETLTVTLFDTATFPLAA